MRRCVDGVRSGRSCRALRSWKLRPSAVDAGSAGPGTDLDTCTKPGLNLGTWPVPMPAPSGVCTAGRKRVSLSQLCGGRVPVGIARLPAALPHGGACGVAAVCRRPVKDPPRQFGERAFTGFPWVPTWLWGLVGLKCRSVRRHPGLGMPQRPRRCRQQAKRSLAGRACAPWRPRFEDCCAHYCSDSRDCAW